MKLRNKKTGEIKNVNHNHVLIHFNDGETRCIKSLAELNEEWEDVATEEVWYLGERIGNYSMPKKEARKATEKILAWKRLKDKGFKFTGWNRRYCDEINYQLDTTEDMSKDLDLLFGGKDDNN